MRQSLFEILPFLTSFARATNCKALNCIESYYYNNSITIFEEVTTHFFNETVFMEILSLMQFYY